MTPTVKYPFCRLKDANAPYNDEIIAAATRVIESGSYIGGAELEAFEAELAAATHAPWAVGVSNGLDALRLIFRAYIELGKLAPGDEVIVPANTYIASVLAVTDNALTPVFVEPDITTLNLDTQLIEAAITPRTRAIMPVHLYGRVCWDDTLANLARKHELIVVEDNAQAIGAEAACNGLFTSRKTGALGHAGAFSFYPTKNIGALGDGGAVVTHDKALADAVRALRNYGSDRQYHNIYQGLNCRLDTLQAAILRIKLKHLNTENEYRRKLARIYQENITNSRVIKPEWVEGDQHVWHQYIVRVDDREAFRQRLLSEGVQTAIHYATPPHLQPCYSQYSHLSLPVTTEIARTVVSLPITRTTSAADALAISHIINKY